MRYSAYDVLNIFLDLKSPKTNARFFEVEILKHSEYELKEINLDDLNPGYTDEDRLNEYLNLTSEPPPIILL